MNYSKYKKDKKNHRTYWMKKEITPESVITKFKSYSLSDYFSDLNEVLEFLIVESRSALDRGNIIKTKQLIYSIILSVGLLHESVEEIHKKTGCPEKSVRAMAKMYWYETDLLHAIFDREVTKVKKLSPDDQETAFLQLLEDAYFPVGRLN